MDFPFVRGQEYPFTALREFQSELLSNRQNDPGFSDNLRCNNIPWAKLYNEEIVPISLLADEKRFGGRETFKLMPEGHAADVLLGLNTGDIPCQVTLADPMWDNMGPSIGSSYVHSLRMELLSEGLPAFGGGKTYKKDGEIVSEPHALDNQERCSACKLGLIQAIERKQNHDGSGFALLVYARDYRFQLIDFDLAAFVSSIVQEIGHVKFAPLWIVDSGFLSEVP